MSVEALVIGFGITIAYFLPSIIASSRKLRRTPGIFLLNIFAGWTGIGWFFLLGFAILIRRHY